MQAPVLILGAGGAIGGAIARKLAGDGKPVIRSSLVTPEGAAEVADWIRSQLAAVRAPV